jgi:hypothetical protein
MAITKLEAFKTSDDTLFANYGDALTHENKLDLEKWYDENPILGYYQTAVDWNDVRYWLIETGLFTAVAEAVLTKLKKES